MAGEIMIIPKIYRMDGNMAPTTATRFYNRGSVYVPCYSYSYWYGTEKCNGDGTGDGNDYYALDNLHVQIGQMSSDWSYFRAMANYDPLALDP